MRSFHYFSSLLLGLCLLTSCTTQINHRVNDSVGTTMVDLQNRPLRFANYQGKWVFINYWSYTCEACVAEIPALNQFYARHKDVVIIGVNYDDMSAKQLQQAVRKLNITYPVVMQQYDPYKKLGISPPQGIPTTVIISPNGMVTESLVGQQSVGSLERIVGR